MSKPAVLARRAISPPRGRRTVIEATPSLRSNFSLTTLRTTSFAFTRYSPLFSRFRVGKRDRQHHIAQTFAVDVLRERDGDATAERILDDEIERLQIAQRVPPHRALSDVLESFGHPFRRQLPLEKIPMPGIVADHRNV